MAWIRRHIYPIVFIGTLLFMVAFIGLIFALPQTRLWLSPGPLSAQAKYGTPIQGFVSHFDFQTECGRCHRPFGGPSDARCLSCHDDVRQRPDLHRDPEGTRFRANTRLCGACHVDHRGPLQDLTVFDPARFNHELTGFSLEKHRQRDDGQAFACSDCHGADFTAAVQETCFTCHRGRADENGGAWMEQHRQEAGDDCVACHRGEGKAKFDHKGRRPLKGEARCAFCHRKDMPENHVEFGGDRQDCRVCHDPTRDWEEAVFDHAALPADVQCSACHREDMPDEHVAFGGDRIDCAYCHLPDGWSPSTFRHERIAAGTSCSACHRPAMPEGHVAFGGDRIDCGQCHTTAAWDQVTFDHAALPADAACAACHRDAMPEGHTAFGGDRIDCGQCHTTVAWDQVTFSHDRIAAGTPCNACHRQPPANHASFGGARADCAACHDTAAWTPARFDLRYHTFPVNHGGADARCETCHPNAATYAEYTCYNCHAHTPDKVRREHVEEGIFNFEGRCVECHPTGREEEGEDD